ncbi:DUF1642 domain-containing protein [Enterococcus hirae]
MTKQVNFRPKVKSINIANEELTKITLEVKNNSLDGKLDELRKFSNKVVTVIISEETIGYTLPINKPIETLIHMKDGYEVEKEPLYEVIIGNLFLVKKFNNKNDSCFVNKFELCWWEKSAYQLTEPEIKAIDERYWPFAVPVEEVAEG